MTLPVIYGIKSCDTVRKARRWMDDRKISYRFRDLREEPVSKRRIESWIDHMGWEAVLNKRSTTWRSLDEHARCEIDASSATDLLTEYPTLVKRPVLEYNDTVMTGFNATAYQALLG